MVRWRQGVINRQWRIHVSDFIMIEASAPSVTEQAEIGEFFANLYHFITLNQRELSKRQIRKNPAGKDVRLRKRIAVIKVDTRTIDFFDRHVSRLIIEKYSFAEMEAIRIFIESATYQMLIDTELEVYKISPRIVFDMWESERVTGDPRNSQYLRSDEDE
jgi:hypothetical protein